MSGGSMDYLYCKLDAATFDDSTPLRRAFRKHLKLVAKALHDIEWVESGDYSPGDEDAAIRKVVKPEAELAQLIEDACEIRRQLESALDRVGEGEGGES